jgi:DNA-binding FadR family transcriptional regulator
MARFLEEGEEAGDDVEAFARVDVDFHDAILAATGNRPVQSLLRMIEPTLLAARIASPHEPPRQHEALAPGAPRLSPNQLAGRGRRS